MAAGNDYGCCASWMALIAEDKAVCIEAMAGVEHFSKCCQCHMIVMFKCTENVNIYIYTIYGGNIFEMNFLLFYYYY